MFYNAVNGESNVTVVLIEDEEIRNIVKNTLGLIISKAPAVPGISKADHLLHKDGKFNLKQNSTAAYFYATLYYVHFTSLFGFIVFYKLFLLFEPRVVYLKVQFSTSYFVTSRCETCLYLRNVLCSKSDKHFQMLFAMHKALYTGA